MAGQATRLFDAAVFESKISKSISEDKDESQDEKDTKDEKKETKEYIAQSFCIFNIFPETVLHTAYYLPLHISPDLERQSPPPDELV